MARCKSCKRNLPRGKPGRPAKYCSAACRQKAYRKRSANPYAVPLRLLRNDMDAVKDRDARMLAAVRMLNNLGYEVSLNWVGTKPRQAERPSLKLKLVDRDKPKE